MADLWVGLWQAWGTAVHSGAVSHTASTGPVRARGDLWLAGDALGETRPAPTRKNRYFSPIPSTTPITTDPYL